MGMWGDIAATGTSSMGSNWEIGLSLIGRAIAQGDIDKANAIYDDILRDIEAEDIPEFERVLEQQIPQFREIQMGSSGRTAQQGAIDRLTQFIDQGGMDDQARAQLQESMSLEDQRSRGNRDAILQNRARRGMGGSGDELSALLSEGQGSANRGRNASLSIAASARQRALDSLGKQSQVAGQMRGQDISIDKANQDAAQEREMFNAKMRMAAANANNQGQMDNAYLRLAKRNMVSKAKSDKAGRRLAGAKQTMSDWGSVGRGMNMKHQTAAEGASEMPV